MDADRAAAIARLMEQPWGPLITDQPKGQTMQTFTAVDGSTVTPKTRADLMKHPDFADLETDNDGNPCVWQNEYFDNDGAHWFVNWSCQCDDEGVSPSMSAWIPDYKGLDKFGNPDDAAYRLWDSLPEAGATYPTPILPGAMVKTATADQHAAASNQLWPHGRDVLAADQPQPMWLCAWVTNHGNNDLRDSFTIHESEAEALAAYDLLMIVNQNLHSAAIAPISKATEPHWQDQR